MSLAEAVLRMFGHDRFSSNDPVYTTPVSIRLSTRSAWGRWRYVTDVPGRGGDQLNDAAAVDPNDAWAVGGRTYSGRPRAVHWDGKEWREVAVPGQGSLERVSASACDDAWAIAWGPDIHSVVHWDGRDWAAVTVAPIDGLLALYGVRAFGSRDVWIAGAGLGQEHGRGKAVPVVQHWNGEHWSNVDLPVPDRNASLIAVDGTAPDDVWAVGTVYADLVGNTPEPCCLHWNGDRWNRIPAPSAEPGVVESLTFLARDSVVVAVNRPDESSAEPIAFQPALHQWDGRNWRELPAFEQLTNGFVHRTAPDGDGGLWAVGLTDGERVFCLHWKDGSSIPVSIGPRLADRPCHVLSVTNVPGSTDMWAVGYVMNGTTTDGLIVAYESIAERG